MFLFYTLAAVLHSAFVSRQLSCPWCLCFQPFHCLHQKIQSTYPRLCQPGARVLFVNALLASHAHELNRALENGVFIRLHTAEYFVVSVPSSSSVFLLTALHDIIGNVTQHFEWPELADNHDDIEHFAENASSYRQEHQRNASLSVSGNRLELLHDNGTLQWSEDICKIGHFVQIEQNIVGITSVNVDLLLQLQAVAHWVLLHCNVVIPVTADDPGDQRFLRIVNASLFDNTESSVAALHRAAVAARRSVDCGESDYGYEALKNCANSLPLNDTFNSTLLLEIFEPFAASSKTFAVHSASCARWDGLPQAGMRPPTHAKSNIEMWVSCIKTRRVLAASKYAIMLLQAVTAHACELHVRRAPLLVSFDLELIFVQVFPLDDIQNVRSISSDSVWIITRSSGAVTLQLNDFPSLELNILLTTVNLWALRR